MSCESHFIQQPESLTVVDGESITLNCQASSQEGLEYSWMLNGMLFYILIILFCIVYKLIR